MGQKRKLIREEIVKRLKNRTRAGSRVVPNRSLINDQETLPLINVYTRSETVDSEFAQAPRLLRRSLVVEIECIDEGEDGAELSDKLDDLSEQVEICLAADDSLDNNADDIVLNQIDIEMDASGDKPAGRCLLSYVVRYNEYSPRKLQKTLGDFSGINAEWQVGHDNEAPTMAEADRAKDNLTVGV